MRKRHPIPLISFLIIQIFWMSLYSEGVFRAIGGVRAQVAILLTWLMTLVLFAAKGQSVALRALRAHGAEIGALAIFFLVNTLNVVLGRGDLAYAYFVRSLLLLITYATVVIHLRNDGPRYFQAGTIVTLTLGLIAVFVLPDIYGNPFAGRFREFEAAGTEAPVVWYGSWSFFMAYAISLPCCIAVAHRQRGMLRFCLYILCAAIVGLIVLSTFAASIILMLMGIVALLALSIRNRRTYVAIAAIALTYVVLSARYDIGQIPQLEQMGPKIVAIFDWNQGIDRVDDNDPKIRFKMMLDSLSTFKAHPLLGTGLYSARGVDDESIGQHSGVADGLAQYGLLGIVWYFAFLAICGRRLLLALKNDRSNLLHHARLVTFGLFLMGAAINPMFFDAGICALVFILALSPIGPDTIAVPSPRVVTPGR